ncbi:NAD-dependent epimerase/dehydratase family protein [Streptomyces sp. NPDC086549]|uniref:NAD-dependent epimerase/dehydratase family protein n=1 Tax=Streptomyces sp. NPDC086549 TaxID=3365752 RepID=UPI0038013296
MARHVLITGASGFIGRHVVRTAFGRPDITIQLVLHHDAPPAAARRGVDTVRADLSDPASVRGLCRGVDAVVHCASRVSGDEEVLRAVNDRGTEALMADALRHGVRRVVYVSTAAVYGRGPFREADARSLSVRPLSAASRTRAAAERHVLAAGGTVLRPHLVYGTGDRWVIPGLAWLMLRLGAAPTCTSSHSAVDVDALARAALAAALSDRDPAGVHHVNHPCPVRGQDLVEAVLAHLRQGVTGTVVPDLAKARLADDPRALHHFEMLATDHWFAGDDVWRLLGCDPGTDPVRGLARHARWYREQLGSLRAGG